nr:unnamed protein product [Haemonchus contortus]
MGGRVKNPLRNTPYDAGMRFDQLTGEQANYAVGISTRYYYNPIDGQCHPFTYNGFLGNFNNFHTQADCQLFCARLQCVHGNPLTTGHGVPQRCQRDIDCPSTHTCTTEHGVCCPTPQTLCTEPLRVGDCKQSVRQFWYNAETKTCESFLYTGCQGNNNRFHTLNECQSYCKNINAEPKCPQGRAYIDYSGKFLQCGDGLGGNACPANYECHFDGLIHGCCPSKAFTCSLQVSKGVACGSGSSYRYYYNNQLKIKQNICCGEGDDITDKEAKPKPERPHGGCERGSVLLYPSTQESVQCDQKTRACPSGYLCLPHTTTKQHIQLNRGVGLASWEFRADSLQLDQLICMFSCGEVRRGKILRKDTDPTDVAIKTVGGRSQEAKEKIRELMIQCRLLNDLYHPCVVQYFGVCLIGQPNCFVFEYVSDGRLDDWLRAHRNLKRDDLLLMVMSAGWGLEYLHQNTILHRDIAAKNCLYDKQFLSGFGKIKKTDSYTMKSSRKMAIKWMAPESIESSVFTQKSDVYGYGILIYEIFAVKEPYEGRSTAEAKSLVIMVWMQAYTGMELRIVGGEGRSVAAIHQKMDALITKDVELQSLPGFEKTQAKTFVHKKRKK